MNHYSNISWWENRKRARILRCFHEHVITYLRNVATDLPATLQNSLRENSTAQRARTEINFTVDQVRKIVHAAGVNTNVIRTSPPASGGRSFEFDLLSDLFLDLGSYGISPNLVTDLLERSIGIYEMDASRSFRRTINPLWWITRFVVGIGRSPFRVLAAIGFDMERAERSFMGKSIKAIISLIATFASLLLIAERLDFLSDIRSIFGLR